jgi:2-polyprenyl-3-methyl-5-hydroxy-6-metoxy-1,4-benzoquinol methylase
MNRKQRRALGHSGAGPGFAAAAGAAGAGTSAKLAKMLDAAIAHHRAGALVKAERQYRDILALFPRHAEAESRLGAVLLAQGKGREAIPHLERAVALEPALFEALGNLAQAHMATGRPELAIHAASRAFEIKETPQGRTLLAAYLTTARFTADDNGHFGKLALRALVEGWARPRELTGVCIDLIKLDRAVNDAIARVNAAWPARLSATDLFGPAGPGAVSQHRLLGALLVRDPVADIGLERLLTNVRHAMLAAAAADEICDERRLAFYGAVAQQCFINEYVFSMTEAEVGQARQIRALLEDALASGQPCSALWPAVVGAYFPLHTLSNAQALLGRDWPEGVAALLELQIKEPARERQLAATIPVLTGIDDAVSRLVRQQYEESPYPRWIKTVPPGSAHGRPATADRARERRHDVLVAGCGTGLSTIELALQARGAQILAIDLSLASLGYAKRMAEKFGLADIEFAQADILNVASLGREFDFIDASGVLHHLADPWQGWRALLSLLRPGGTMQVGLYSDQARRNIVAARALIAARGYLATAPDIRRAREDIVASSDDLLQSLTRGQDFYTTSECRDLLFHVQEHRIALPEIKSFLKANDLIFTGFILDPATAQRFAARYPERAALTDLDRWHGFETERPDTFAAMYRFQVLKRPMPDDKAT